MTMEVVGEPLFSSLLPLHPPMPLSTSFLRGLLSPALPFGFGGVVFPTYVFFIWCIYGREGVVPVSSRRTRRRPSPNHQTFSFVMLRFKLQRSSSVFRLERKRNEEKKSLATRKTESVIIRAANRLWVRTSVGGGSSN